MQNWGRDVNRNEAIVDYLINTFGDDANPVKTLVEIADLDKVEAKKIIDAWSKVDAMHRFKMGLSRDGQQVVDWLKHIIKANLSVGEKTVLLSTLKKLGKNAELSETVHEAEAVYDVDFGSVYVTIAALDAEKYDVMIHAFNDDGKEVFDDGIVNVKFDGLEKAIIELTKNVPKIKETPGSWGYRV